MVRRLRAAFVCALVLAAGGGLYLVAGAQGAEKVLAPFKGTVGYQPSATAPVERIFGRKTVADDAYAVTQEASLATLTLPDSSQVAIGERTTVQVGAFNTAAAGPGSTLTLNHGALRFAVVHPAGVRSNYTFKTGTSQIAVRGTTGYLIVGDNGTQLICVDCAPGDVTILVNGQTVGLLTGQTITILGTPPGPVTFTITQIDQSYNPSVLQFLLLIGHPDVAYPPGGSGGSDPTGYLPGGGSRVGSPYVPIAVFGAVIGAILSNTGGNSASPSPSPQPLVTPTPTPTPTPTGTGTPIPYGTLTVSTNDLSFNGVGGAPQTFTVAQSGPGGSITIGAPACNGDGASATDSPGSVPITAVATPQTISVNAVAAPTTSPPPTHACSITVTGGNGQTAIVNVDITSTSVGVHGTRRTDPAPPTPAPTPPPGGHPPH
jgi:hypothetical protein